MITTTMQHMHHLFLVGGRYHNSGGNVLDGLPWRDMPPEIPEERVASAWS
jgi:hypothetical protein